MCDNVLSKLKSAVAVTLASSVCKHTGSNIGDPKLKCRKITQYHSSFIERPDLHRGGPPLSTPAAPCRTSSAAHSSYLKCDVTSIPSVTVTVLLLHWTLNN